MDRLQFIDTRRGAGGEHPISTRSRVPAAEVRSEDVQIW